jgi:DNA-binding NarL/FixJ family response regulator
MDSISMADAQFRKEMERASDQLVRAIHWARKGYNPATPTEPMKLPPDWSSREQRVIEMKERAVPRPSNERIREMMERGMKPGEIARELKMSAQKVTWVMKAIKLQRRRDDFEERLNQQL